MRGGIFCYRKEAPKIVDFLYFSLRKAVRMRYDDSIKLIVDLTAGSGCLAELVTRALAIKGSEAVVNLLLLLDKKPWPISTLFFGLWRVRMMPRLYGLRVRFEATKDDPRLKELADSLNAWAESFISSEPLGLHADIYSTSTQTYDLAFLRTAFSEGRLQVKIVDAESFFEDFTRKNSNVGRLPIVWILDPPRYKATRSYYGEDRSFVPRLIEKMYERKATPVIYVDRYNARDVLDSDKRRIVGYYKLYQQGKAGHSFATYMRVMFPTSAIEEGIIKGSIDDLPTPKDVRKYDDKWRVFGMEEDLRYIHRRSAYEKHKIHVWELFGVQDRWKPIVEKLPERDFMKNKRSSLEDFLGGLLRCK